MNLSKGVAGLAGLAFFAASAMVQASDLSKADKKFLDMAADSSMREAHLGQMAQAQAAKSSVKDFGQTLAQDHTKAYESLTELASKAGTTVPKGIDVRKDKPVGALARLEGNKFDRQFLNAEIRENQREIAEFKREAHNGRDPEVKGYASKMIPTLEEELRTAENLAKPERKGS